MRHLFVPVLAFVLLYGTRVLFGIALSNALPELLFSNVAAMTLIGFNAHQVAAGLSTRGQVAHGGQRIRADGPADVDQRHL